VRLETERLVLRSLEAGEAPALLEFRRRNRAFLAPWEPSRDEAFFELPSCAETIALERRELEEGRGLKLHFFEKGGPGPEAGPGSRIAGYAGLSNIVYGPFLSCFLGYRLDAERLGRGYMAEALRAILELAFAEYGLHRIEANILPRNAASIRVVRALGFELEGSSPKYLKIDGRWEDHDHYVLRNAALE